MFPVGSRSRNRGRGFAFNRGAKVPPSFVFDFLRGSLDSRITYTGSNGTLFNSSGTLTAATTNVARFDYDPSTLIARGLLIEEARTNSIRNNTMQGASAGTPGTAPTNWSITSGGGVTRTIIGTGTESGISYIDVRFQTAGAANAFIVPEIPAVVAASVGQVWNCSFYVKLVGGSYSGITQTDVDTTAYSAVPAVVSDNPVVFTATSAGLATQRVQSTHTMPATTASVTAGIRVIGSGAFDITLRIGMPQLELGAFATSVISTSSAAVTRAADIASITGASFSSFWNATQGTFVTQYLFNRTIGSGEFPSVVTANDGTTSNQVAVYAFVSAGNNRSSFLTSVAGVTQADLGSGSATFNGASGTAHKLAGAYAANNFAASFDGSATLTDTSGSLPTLDRLTLGAQGNGTQYLNGWIQSLVYYPQGMPTLLRSLSA